MWVKSVPTKVGDHQTTTTKYPQDATGLAISSPRPQLGAAGWMLVIYFFFEYVRPQSYVPFIAQLHVPLILSMLLLILWLAQGSKSVLKDPLILLFASFIIAVAASVTFAVNTFWVYQFTKVLTIYFIVALAFSTFVRGPALYRFFSIWIGLQALVALNAALGGGKGTGSFLVDTNDLALAMDMAIPYAYFLGQSSHITKKMKILLRCTTALMMIGVIVSYSRGGFVGLIVVCLAFLAYSKNRASVLLLLIFLGSVTYLLVPQSYIDRISTITDTTDFSRNEHLDLWGRGQQMFFDHPVLGVGAGNFPWSVRTYELRDPHFDPDNDKSLAGRPAHSLYFTLLPELGLVGGLLYGALAVLLLRRLWRISHRAKSNISLSSASPDSALLARAMMVSLFAFLTAGAFLSVLYYPHFWYLLGFGIALQQSTSTEARDIRKAQ
jgi:probable O-glycosylation ligase (exosortase A-associated)